MTYHQTAIALDTAAMLRKARRYACDLRQAQIDLAIAALKQLAEPPNLHDPRFVSFYEHPASTDQTEVA